MKSGVRVGIVSVLTHHIRCFARLEIRSDALECSRFLVEQSLTQLVVTLFQQFHLLWSAAAAMLARLHQNMSTTQFAAVCLILAFCLSLSLQVPLIETYLQCLSLQAALLISESVVAHLCYFSTRECSQIDKRDGNDSNEHAANETDEKPCRLVDAKAILQQHTTNCSTDCVRFLPYAASDRMSQERDDGCECQM